MPEPTLQQANFTETSALNTMLPKGDLFSVSFAQEPSTVGPAALPSMQQVNVGTSRWPIAWEDVFNAGERPPDIITEEEEANAQAIAHAVENVTELKRADCQTSTTFDQASPVTTMEELDTLRVSELSTKKGSCSSMASRVSDQAATTTGTSNAGSSSDTVSQPMIHEAVESLDVPGFHKGSEVERDALHDLGGAPGDDFIYPTPTQSSPLSNATQFRRSQPQSIPSSRTEDNHLKICDDDCLFGKPVQPLQPIPRAPMNVGPRDENTRLPFTRRRVSRGVDSSNPGSTPNARIPTESSDIAGKLVGKAVSNAIGEDDDAAHQTVRSGYASICTTTSSLQTVQWSNVSDTEGSVIEND